MLRRFSSITSKHQWFSRQSKDEFVKARISQGYRSRAALKLLEIDEKFKIIKGNVLDLGCAPGSWLQVASRKSTCVGIDLLDVEPIPNCTIHKGDARTFKNLGLFNTILSDMAHSFTGNSSLDNDRVALLVEFALEMCKRHLARNGNFVVKFMNGSRNELKEMIEQEFEKVVIFKPRASRKESSEFYFIAKGKLRDPM